MLDLHFRIFFLVPVWIDGIILTGNGNFYGSHCIMFITKLTTFTQPNTTKVYYNQNCYHYLIYSRSSFVWFLYWYAWGRPKYRPKYV